MKDKIKGGIDMNVKLVITKELSKVTKKVFKNFNRMSDQEFMNLYKISKAVYLKRVLKYGDPFKNAPLAKIGKFLGRFSIFR